MGKRKRTRTKRDANVMDVQFVDMSTLVASPRNPRKGNIAAIADSLSEFGQHRPIVVQQDTNVIIAGNHLLRAAKSLGWTNINVQFVDDDDRKAIRRMIADNAVGDLSRWDDDVQLASMIEEVSTGALIPGIDEKAMKKWLGESQTPVSVDDFDELDVTSPPKRVWVVIACPLHEYQKISDYVDAVSDVDGVKCSVIGSDA